MQKNFPNFKHFLGKAASRKGMGMELALLVLFVVMACSILLVSSAMVGKDNLNDRKEQMLQRIELEQIVKQAQAERSKTEIDNYSLKWDEDTLTISDKEENVLLTVTITGDKITYWQYR